MQRFLSSILLGVAIASLGLQETRATGTQQAGAPYKNAERKETAANSGEKLSDEKGGGAPENRMRKPTRSNNTT